MKKCKPTRKSTAKATASKKRSRQARAANAKLKIAVAGLGRIGWSFHAHTLAKHPDYELVAVADPMPERRAEAEATFGARAYAKTEDMLRHPGLDVAVIATPTHLHKPHALLAFRQGLHVFLEKPMASTLAEAEAIAAEAKKRRRVLSIYQPRRVDASFRHVAALLATGKIGKIYHIRRGMYQYARRNDWQALQKYGGGMLNNYGAHGLDMLLQVTGYNVKQLFCTLGLSASLGDADDVVKIVYCTTSGFIGELDINQASPIAPYSLQVWGSRGTLELRGNKMHIAFLKPSDLKPKELNPSLASHAREYPHDNIKFREEIIEVDPAYALDVYTDFAEAVRFGKTPHVQPQETIALMRLIARCRAVAGDMLKIREAK